MRIAALAFVLLPIPLYAQVHHNCPEGFRYVGTLSGAGSESNPFDKRMTLNFPENATLDESFQQKNVCASNGKSSARSNMRPQDIPKGVLVIPSGKEDKIYEPRWAVSDPELKAIE